MPAPKPMSSARSPGASRPSSAASASAIGIEAAEVLPVVARMFDGAVLVDRRAAAHADVMMRLLAWWGTKRRELVGGDPRVGHGPLG